MYPCVLFCLVHWSLCFRPCDHTHRFPVVTPVVPSHLPTTRPPFLHFQALLQKASLLHLLLFAKGRQALADSRFPFCVWDTGGNVIHCVASLQHDRKGFANQTDRSDSRSEWLLPKVTNYANPSWGMHATGAEIALGKLYISKQMPAGQVPHRILEVLGDVATSALRLSPLEISHWRLCCIAERFYGGGDFCLHFLAKLMQKSTLPRKLKKFVSTCQRSIDINCFKFTLSLCFNTTWSLLKVSKPIGTFYHLCCKEGSPCFSSSKEAIWSNQKLPPKPYFTKLGDSPKHGRYGVLWKMPLICRLEPSYFLPFLGRFLEKALSLTAIHSVNHSPSTIDFANGKDYMPCWTRLEVCDQQRHPADPV